MDGYVQCEDCDDNDPNTYPGANEICDGLDNDCDGQVPPEEIDWDNDGYSECMGDCDDDDVDINPGMPEICDGKDNDCDGFIDCWDTDCKSYTGPPEDCSQYHPECGTKPHNGCDFTQSTKLDKGTYYFSDSIDIQEGVHTRSKITIFIIMMGITTKFIKFA